MNPHERVMPAIAGEEPDRVPVIPAAREWCIRQAGFNFREAMGEAAGTAAALSVKYRVAPRDIHYEVLREQLINQGVPLPNPSQP